MITDVLTKIFGTKDDRELKRLRPLVQTINGLEASLTPLSDVQLAAKTAEFRQRLEQMLAAGDKLTYALDEILPEAFAVCREAARRALGMRHFDVQLIGGYILHRGKIAEMKTGEGKTLVATLPLYLNALAGKGCHLVTVNDYLAKRDAEWMGKVYRFLGMEVGVVTHELNNAQRKAAYGADITYGTNNEFGFDYLRDNMKYDLADYVQREHFFAIVDEVDSILIDEARTPLIISGPTDENPELYKTIDLAVRRLIAEEKKLGTDPTADPKTSDNAGTHYHVDLEHRSVSLTEAGIELAEKITGVANLYAPEAIETLHHVQQSLRAHTLYQLDVEYVVKDGEVIIVDEFTGRMMPGRRWSDGLHQAVEAKEGVKIESENQTLASITFQNYFKLYDKLAGMTGTAKTEAAEFFSIYKLDVTAIPTNKTISRSDEADLVFKREPEKFKAIATSIKELHDKGAPVLVGTTSVEKSERIEAALVRQGIPAKKINVLNAKQHEREAEIVAQAGTSGAITIATNMAGRGTDIVLGGNPEYVAWRMLGDRGISREDLKAEQFIKMTMLGQLDQARAIAAEDERLDASLIDVILDHKAKCDANHEAVVAAGGLHIIGTERHESRRVDNQLRGRAGRQGDPGWSQFFLSLEDDLIKVFSGNRILKVMDRLGMEEDDAIQHPWLDKSIASAQQKVEARNFEIRKNLLEYDNVMNQQRTTVYKERRRILAGENLEGFYAQLAEDFVWSLVDAFAPAKTYPEDWDWKGIEEALSGNGVRYERPLPDACASWTETELADHLKSTLLGVVEDKKTRFGNDVMQFLLKQILLLTLDQLWKDHLLAMDHLREGIGLRGYGQKDPKREYAREGYNLFQQMLALFHENAVKKICMVEPRVQVDPERLATLERQLAEHGSGQRQIEQHPGQQTYGVSGAATLPAPAGPAGIPQQRLPQQARTPLAAAAPAMPVVRDQPRVGRNDPCPCGSGKKYKKCHYPQYD